MTQARCVTLFWTSLPRTTERTTTAPLSRCSMCKVRRGISWLCWRGSILPPDPRCHLHTPIASERQVKDSCATPTHRSEWASTSGHTCLSPVSHQESSASSVHSVWVSATAWSQDHVLLEMGRRDDSRSRVAKKVIVMVMPREKATNVTAAQKLGIESRVDRRAAHCVVAVACTAYQSL